MQNIILFLLIAIPLAGFVVDRYLEYLNNTMWSDILPEKLKGVCSEDDYRKSQLYQRENNRLSFWTSLFNLAVIIGVILSGGFALLDEFVRSYASNDILVSLGFFLILGFASDLLNLPFSVYDTFVIENRFGFNKMTARTFVTDHLKSWLLAILIGGPVLALITWLYYRMGSHFWLFAWGMITIFTVFINFFYSELIVPLFNKQTPLPVGSLREKIVALAEKTGFKLNNIYVIDGSKRSTKANAYFSGFGAKKRIVLYDTLEKDLSEDEIVAVLAHEIGHYRKKHVILKLLSSVFVTGLMLFLFSLIVGNPALSEALGSEKASFHLGLIVFGILYSPVSLVLGLVSNYVSRRHEFEADNFAKQNSKGEFLADALKKLSVKNLTNMMPHPVYVFFHYSHPPLLSRLGKLE